MFQSATGVEQRRAFVADVYRGLPWVVMDKINDFVGKVVYVNHYMFYAGLL